MILYEHYIKGKLRHTKHFRSYLNKNAFELVCAKPEVIWGVPPTRGGDRLL